MRSLAFFGWVCLVLASSPTLAQSNWLASAQDVYDTWIDWLWDYDADIASRCNSASDIWAYFHSGLWPLPVVLDYVEISGELRSTAGLSWLSHYPIIFSEGLHASEPSPVSYLPSDFNLPSDASPLVSSIWYSRFSPLNSSYPLASFISPVSSSQPNGQLVVSSVRVASSNIPVGKFGVALMATPLASASGYTGFDLTPETYYEITGEWPSSLGDSWVVIFDKGSFYDMLKNASIRILERWR